MADKRKGGNGFGVPDYEDDFDDVVICDVKPTDSSLSRKSPDLNIGQERNESLQSPVTTPGKDNDKPKNKIPAVTCPPSSSLNEEGNSPVAILSQHVPHVVQANLPTNTVPPAEASLSTNYPQKNNSYSSAPSESIQPDKLFQGSNNLRNNPVFPKSAVSHEKTITTFDKQKSPKKVDVPSFPSADEEKHIVDEIVHVENVEDKQIAMQVNVLTETTSIPSSQGDDMNNETVDKISPERKGGAGFGVPTPCDDEIEMSVPVATATKAAVAAQKACEVRKGGGGFGIPQNIDDVPVANNSAETLNDVVIPIEEGGDYPFKHKKAIQKKAVAEETYEAIALQETFITRLQKWYLSSLVILAAILGFYTITQTTNFLVQLKGCPVLVKYPLYVAVGIFALVIFFFICKLIRSWFSLRQSPQVSLGMLSVLSKRRDLQEKCDKKNEDACKDLYAILSGIKDDEYKRTLKAMNVPEEDINALAVSRRELCKRHEARLAGKGRESEGEWIDSFAEIYQTKLDYIAKERIKYYSYRGGLAATVSHVSAMDRFIILSAMFGLANDLIAIYNLKPSRINSTILLSKIIINGFCAGYVQDAAESVGNITSKITSCISNSIPFASAIGKASELSAEFTAHVVLIQRVGVAAQKMLYPIVM